MTWKWSANVTIKKGGGCANGNTHKYTWNRAINASWPFGSMQSETTKNYLAYGHLTLGLLTDSIKLLDFV